jgi:hypothetical protein
MRPLCFIALLLSLLVGVSARNGLLHSQTVEHPSTPDTLTRLSKLADEAHKEGDTGQEIEYRRQFSQAAWSNFALHPKSPGRFNRWAIVFFNDLPLGLLLEGTHEWPEAEAVFRHNQTELAYEGLAGNDIKSENQLDLAFLLTREGKQPEARNICSHWKNRVRHTADFALDAVKHDVPTPPLYDTPGVETAQWDLACGASDEGLKLISEQIEAHPQMLVSFTVLSHYYIAQGDFQEARKAESDGTSAVTRRVPKSLEP